MKKVLKISYFISMVIIILLLITFAFFLNYLSDLNNELTLNSNLLTPTTYSITINDSNGNEIYDFKNENNDNQINFTDLNQATIDAFTSIEDKEFFKHDGLNYKRMVSALYNNILNKKIVQGASTISQQLIKNTHLNNEKTLERKLKEFVLTKKLESEYSKEEILEMYLNAIYFGEGSYGIKNASKKYFNKDVTDLTLNESAILAGLIKAPAYYSPITHGEDCFTRKNIVLKEMCEDKKITNEQLEDCLNQKITLDIQTSKNNTNFNDLYIKGVLNQAENILNIDEDKIKLLGYKIDTYFNSERNEALKNNISDSKFYPENTFGNISDGLAIIINNKNNGIEAYAGNSQYDLTYFKRQPGSAIKPILVYSPAIEDKLISPCTMILDEKINIDGYSPNNVGGTFSGYVSVRDSICKSLNIPAIKVMEKVGINNCKKFSEKAGIYFDSQDNNYALALGGFTTGLDLATLTNSFTAFPNLGKYNSSSFIKTIYDCNGNIIYKHSEEQSQIMKESTASLINNMLIDGVKKGTSKNLSNLTYDVAGKTGTVAVKNSNWNTDAISVAYTSEITMGVWLGNYSYDEKYNLEGSNNGGTNATKIIDSTFKNIYDEKDLTPSPFIIPNSVVQLEIDNKSLIEENKILLSNSTVPPRYIIKEWFAIDNKPSDESTKFNTNNIDDLSIKYNSDANSVKIEFTPRDYLKYDIHLVDLSNKDIIINSVENVNNHQVIDYNKLNYDNKYFIYVNIYSIYNNINTYTDNVSFITNTKKEISINNNNWYFY